MADRKRPRLWVRTDGDRLNRTADKLTSNNADYPPTLPPMNEESGLTKVYHYGELRDQLITQNNIFPRDRVFEAKFLQTSGFFKLPEEVMMLIFDLLPYKDVITMTETCKSFAEFVYRNFVPIIVLPLSPQNLKKIDGRTVFFLKSTFNIMALEKYRKGEYLNNLNMIQMSRLQKLVFVLYEMIDEDAYDTFPYDHILPPLYKDILNHYLSVAKHLVHLHISIDRSEETFQIIDFIAENFPCLTKVVMQATNTPDNVPYPIECEVSEEVKEKALDIRKICKEIVYFLTLNQLLEKLLMNPSIKSLEIRGLSKSQSWGFSDKREIDNSYPLVIKSNKLTHLRIEQNAFCYFCVLKCPELLELGYTEYGSDKFTKLECLIHNGGVFYGGYKKMLQFHCPKLERINDIDTKSVRNRLIGPDAFLTYKEMYEFVCNCEF